MKLQKKVILTVISLQVTSYFPTLPKVYRKTPYLYIFFLNEKKMLPILLYREVIIFYDIDLLYWQFTHNYISNYKLAECKCNIYRFNHHQLYYIININIKINNYIRYACRN